MDIITRLHPLLEILKSSPRRINKIFIQKEAQGGKFSRVIKEAKDKDITYSFVPRQKLDRLSSRHQGVAAVLSPKEFCSLDDILEGSALPFLVLLDEVEDPQNLGAIVRTAECAGVDGIIIPERRSAGLTGAVYSVSAGAIEHVKVARVANLAQTMARLRRKGLWLIGAEAGQEAWWHEFDFKLPLAIIFGSEGKGLRPIIRSQCDKILSIPLQGRLNSLNVSSAAAVFLFEVVRQRAKRNFE